jgi:hypothetical protein
VDLVRRTDDLSTIVDHINRIVVARRLTSTTGFSPHCAGNEQLAILQHIGDSQQRIRIFGQDERYCSFRPDDDIRPLAAIGGRRLSQRQMLFKDRHPLVVIDFLRLIDQWLDEADRESRIGVRRQGLFQHIKAVAEMRGDQQNSKAQSEAHPFARTDKRGRCKDEHSQHIDAGKADHRGRLHHQRHRHGMP